MSDQRLKNAPDPGTLLFEYRPDFRITTTRVFFAERMHAVADIEHALLREKPASQWAYYGLAVLCLVILPTAWENFSGATPFLFLLAMALVAWGRTKVTEYIIVIRTKSGEYTDTTLKETLAQDVLRALKQAINEHRKASAPSAKQAARPITSPAPQPAT